MVEPARVHAALDEVAQQERAWELAAARLAGERDEELRGALGPFVEALSYRLVTESLDDDNDGPFELVSWPVVTRPLIDIDEETREAWAAAMNGATHPFIVARLADLLWVVKAQPGPHRYAQRAIDAYLLLAADSDPTSLVTTDAAERAIELAAKLGDHERLQSAINQASSMVNGALQEEGRSLGVARGLIRAMVDLRSDRRLSDLLALIDSSVLAFQDDPYAVEGFLDLKAATLGGPQPDIRRDQIRRWRTAADAAAAGGDAMQRVHRLERAHELAVRHGLGSEAQEIAVELQSISPDDLGMVTFSEEVTVTDAEMDAALAPLFDGADWSTALRRFGVQRPHTDQQVDAGLDEQRRAAPLMGIFGKTLIGSQSAATVVRTDDDASRLTVDRAQHRAFLTSFSGAVLWASFLSRFAARYGPIEHRDLTDHFTTALVSEPLAERFARGIELYWEGQPDEAAHVLVPRLEAAIRELTRGAGIRIITLPNGARPGGVRGLGEILYELGPALPEPWGAHLQNLLVDQNGGLNLRNNISHGLVTRINQGSAALLIQAACFIANLTPPTPVSSEDEIGKAER